MAFTYSPNSGGSLDAATGARNTVTYPHHEAHAGSAYVTSVYDTDLDIADTLIIAFTTPNTTKWGHFVATMKSSSAGLAEILEGPTITAGTGSAVTIQNRNRNYQLTKVSTFQSLASTPVAGEATKDPTITNDGDLYFADSIGAGKNKGASESRDEGEVILKQGTTYAIRITGVADNGNASIGLSWYEHTNKG